jgi:hypothetical protein
MGPSDSGAVSPAVIPPSLPIQNSAGPRTSDAAVSAHSDSHDGLAAVVEAWAWTYWDCQRSLAMINDEGRALGKLDARSVLIMGISSVIALTAVINLNDGFRLRRRLEENLLVPFPLLCRYPIPLPLPLPRARRRHLLHRCHHLFPRSWRRLSLILLASFLVAMVSSMGALGGCHAPSSPRQPS